LSYGMGWDNLYYKLLKEGVSVGYQQAKMFRERYIASYPQMFHEAEMIAKEAEKNHFVQTLFGRKIPIFLFGNKNEKQRRQARRMAYNQVIQGTAADILKYGEVQVYKKVRESYGFDKVKLILSSHDALAFEVLKEVDLASFLSDMSKCMECQIRGFPPFIVDISVGKGWGDLQKKKREEIQWK